MSREEKSLLSLGANVKAMRRMRGLTQERLSDLCNFDPTYISMIERGKRNPPFLTLLVLARKLECPVSDLTKGI